MVQSSVGRDGAKLRRSVQEGRLPDHVRNRLASNRVLSELSAQVGSAQDQPHRSGQTDWGGLFACIVISLIGAVLILSCIAIVFSILWIVVDLAVRLAIGGLVIVGLFMIVRLLTQASSQL